MATNSLSKKIFTNAQNTILSAAIVISAMYGVSAILSLVRSRMLATHFGASDILGVFYVADRIPNLIYSLLVVGTLSTVFIPIFTDELKKDKDLAWKTASSVVNASLFVFLIFGLIVYIFAKPIVIAVSLGEFDLQQIDIAVRLMRIMLVSQVILLLSSFLTSVLQSFKLFVIPALAPVVYNLGTILGIAFFAPRYGIYSAAYGVLIGALLHLAIQLPLSRHINLKYYPRLNIKDKGLRNVLKLLPPRMLSASLFQITSLANNSLAILVSVPSVVVLKFALQLQTFPVLLFGASIAQAALPTLSYESSGEEIAKFKSIFLTSLHQVMFLVIPFSVILLVLRLPVVRLVYGAANYPWEATLATATALGFFSVSIFAQSAVYLINRAFIALKDTYTPLKVSLITFVISITLSYILITKYSFGVTSIALSYSLASILDVVLLLALLSKKVGGFSLERLVLPFLKISYAAIFMGISLYLPLKVLDLYVLDTSLTLNLLILTLVTGSTGVISYLFFTHIFKVKEVILFYKLVSKIFTKFHNITFSTKSDITIVN
ncbi:murein biosynthesis integral membrane protein MurJ [candidate division WWE3 bacterium]|uniref:Probable lipid II flippase MurJ n=1 Tax=candidate division WWE3 bacterium TaxID=2053526 RepID=A0A955EED1_UNCKA|nr:murein biosynthesis integral membrane protein MurJ [candidate division WWE3 bacterium]